MIPPCSAGGIFFSKLINVHARLFGTLEYITLTYSFDFRVLKVIKTKVNQTSTMTMTMTFKNLNISCPLIFISEFTLELTHGTVKTEQWTLGGWRGVVVRRQRRGAQKKLRPVSISCNSSFEKSHFWNRRPRAKNHIDRFQNDPSLGCNHSAWIWWILFHERKMVQATICLMGSIPNLYCR